MGNDLEKLGVVGETIVNCFNLSISPDTPIYIGLSNRIHMENAHREIYLEYESCMQEIIAFPDYVGINPHDDSLEYYKKYGDITVNIKLAVRPTGKGIYFAKTLYEINEHSLSSYISKGRAKPVK